MTHRAIAYHNLSQFLDAHVNTVSAQRRARIEWKKHVTKHGNVPMVLQCPLCSGKEQRVDVKLGKYKLSRPTRQERDEIHARY